MTSRKTKAVILDRDGVLVIPEFRDGRSYAPKRLEDLQFYADARGAVDKLKQAGFVVVVATNQPDVGAGVVDQDVIDEMHTMMRAEIAVDDIEVCFDTRANPGARRKPEAGMLFDAANKWNIDLKASYVVGDRATDMEAGARADCTNIFIDHEYSAEQRPQIQAVSVTNLTEAVEWILQEEARRSAVAEGHA
jgi:D-glycero-D-manno-heptose 1,7-bisphosphate phosphatase